jgi:hypothetical protein
LLTVVGNVGRVLDLESIEISAQTGRWYEDNGISGKTTSDGRNSLEVGGSTILKENGDGTIGARPGEGEWLTGSEVEVRVGELNGKSTSESRGGEEDVLELHFDY